jgi:RNase P subunit RPR2
MHFCSKCQHTTISNTTRDKWDELKDMITVNCGKCGLFLHRYLVNKREEEKDNE